MLSRSDYCRAVQWPVFLVVFSVVPADGRRADEGFSMQRTDEELRNTGSSMLQVRWNNAMTQTGRVGGWNE